MNLAGTWQVEVIDPRFFSGILLSFDMIIVADCRKHGSEHVNFPPLIWPFDRSSQVTLNDEKWKPLQP